MLQYPAKDPPASSPPINSTERSMTQMTLIDTLYDSNSNPVIPNPIPKKKKRKLSAKFYSHAMSRVCFGSAVNGPVFLL